MGCRGEEILSGENVLIKTYSTNELSFTYTKDQFLQDCVDAELSTPGLVTFTFKTRRDGLECLHPYACTINLQTPPTDLMAAAASVGASQFAPYALEVH